MMSPCRILLPLLSLSPGDIPFVVYVYSSGVKRGIAWQRNDAAASIGSDIGNRRNISNGGGCAGNGVYISRISLGSGSMKPATITTRATPISRNARIGINIMTLNSSIGWQRLPWRNSTAALAILRRSGINQVVALAASARVAWRKIKHMPSTSYQPLAK